MQCDVERGGVGADADFDANDAPIDLDRCHVHPAAFDRRIGDNSRAFALLGRQCRRQRLGMSLGLGLRLGQRCRRSARRVGGGGAQFGVGGDALVDAFDRRKQAALGDFGADAAAFGVEQEFRRARVRVLLPEPLVARR